MDGRALAARIREELKGEIAAFGAVRLATVLVGDDPASQIYIRNKHEKSREAGMASFNHTLPGDTPQDELEDLIQQLGDDSSVHGILLQLPAPDQIDDDAMTALIDPMKDVDGLTPINAGRLVAGKPGMVPATPAGMMELLRAVDTPIEGAEAVVVGRSMLVGKPIASLLLGANATVTHCHSRTRDLAAHTSRADILVAAVGVPEMITGDMVKEGATVLDVGMNRTEAGVKGDIHFDSVEPKARAITPVPGGVGQMTIAMLLQNTLTAARMQAGVAAPS